MIACCPHCGNNFYISRDKVGQRVNCNKCNQQVQIALQDPAETPRKRSADKSIRYNTLYDGINMREGFKRLALVTSFLLGPIIWAVIKAKDFYTLNASFSEPIDNSLRFLVMWGIGFTGCWSAYLGGMLLVRGFAIGRRRRGRKKLVKPLSILAVLSILPLIPGFITMARYIVENPLWYWEDVFKLFVPWPAAGLATVWGSYLIVVFIGNGFRYKCSEHVLQDMRRFEPGAENVDPRAAGSWRSR